VQLLGGNYYAIIFSRHELSSRREHYRDFVAGRILAGILEESFFSWRDLGEYRFLGEILTEIRGGNFSREGSRRENRPLRRDPSGIPVSAGNLGGILAGSRYPFYKEVRLYKTLVKPVLMYGCEAWKINKCDANKIDVFQSRCPRQIFKIHWQERITNKEVLKKAEKENLSEDVRRRRWKFVGHIMRKDLHDGCRTALTWDPEGRRKWGRPRKHGEGLRREKGKKRDGRTGVRYKWQRLTEMVGRIVLRCYVPHGTKKIGNR